MDTWMSARGRRWARLGVSTSSKSRRRVTSFDDVTGMTSSWSEVEAAEERRRRWELSPPTSVWRVAALMFSSSPIWRNASLAQAL